jgi:hypothetical protein
LRTFANCVAVFFILHFLWSYYRNCYGKGYRVDYWHLILFQSLLVTSIMLPFNRSPLNVIAFGPILTKRALPFVDQAFLISALGYGCVILGGNLWRLQLNLGLRKAFSGLLNQPVRANLLLIRSPRLLAFVGLFAFLISVAMIVVYFRTFGLGLDVERLSLSHPALRPLIQFGVFLSVAVGSMALGRYEVRRERPMLFLTLLLAAALFFFGSRSALLGMFQLPLLVWMIRRRTRLSLGFVIILLVGGMVGAILLDALRQGASLSKALLTAGMMIAFGNSFSDTRDFALILSLWKGTLFLGKTYLAGLLAFIPRVLSPFRDQWAFGVVTATIAGFSPTQHAGLRVGTSGEAYLNFGLPAVVLLGLVTGSLGKFVDMRIKESILHHPRDVRVYAYFFLGAIVSALVNSVNFSALYTTLMLLFLSFVLILVSRFIKLPLA